MLPTKESLKRLVPQRVRIALIEPVLRKVGCALVDSGAFLLGATDASIPPTRLHFVGHGSFTATGFEFLRYFTEFGHLQPTDAVLDVGCGIGRMAIPMTNFLRHGRYCGIDIVPEGIEWCQQNITPKHPNFTFQLSDIYNKKYNPKGKWKASEYRFPFEDSQFDFAFLTSVFTHLLPEDAEHYLAEVSRVLRPGGRLLSTWFILNDESRALLRGGSGRSIVNEYRGQDVMVADVKVPEEAIAFSDAWVDRTFSRAHLKRDDTVHFGSWCGRGDYVSYQDIVVATKQ